MSHPYHHAKSSAKKWGGVPADYQAVHDFMDSSKSSFASWQHRAVLHSAFGCYIVEQVFGSTITTSEGKEVPVRVIAEQHIREDLGWIPSLQDWMKHLGHEAWMTKGVQKLEVE